MNKLIKRIKSLHKKSVSYFFPDRCPFCKHTIHHCDYVCDRCKKDVPVHGYFQGVNGGFKCCSPLIYQGKFKRAIIGFKFKKKTQFAPNFAQLIFRQIQESYPDYIFDMITYIPMYPKDEKKRGYNQSQLIAKELSELMKIPCVNTLSKVKRTRPQHKLSATERRHNLKGAFKIIDKNQVKGKTILIIDDIITTGSTLFECSKALEKGKPVQICCATLLTTAHLY